MMRWGMPPPPRTGGPPVTSIRNTSSPHWCTWLKPENRCLVPANSFAEYAPEPNPETKKKDVVWFALNENRPLFAFAGMWTTYNGDRGTKSKPIPGPHEVYRCRMTLWRSLCGERQGGQGGSITASSRRKPTYRKNTEVVEPPLGIPASVRLSS